MASNNSPVCFAQEAVSPLAEVNKTYFKALHFYEHKNWRAAKESFQDFLSISDHNLLFIPSMYYLAYCYQQMHEDQKSLTLYQKVVTQASAEDAFWSQMAQKRMEEISPMISTLN